jgi:hypothetical protein
MDFNNDTNNLLNSNQNLELMVVNNLKRIEIEIFLFSLSIIFILSYIVYINCWLTRRKSREFIYDSHVLM